MIPGPAYRIHTPRLVLRCWEPGDAPKLKEAIDQSLEHLKAWMPWAQGEPEPVDKKIERIRFWRGRFDLGQDFVYGIFSRDESRVLGGSGLMTRVGEGAREIGYWIHADFINQGLATETSLALTRAAFEIDRVERVEIQIDPANLRSQAVPRKLGYTHEATLRRRIPQPDGSFHDLMVYTLLSHEYPGSPAAAFEMEAFDALGRKII